MTNKENDGALYPYDDLGEDELKPTWDRLNKILDDERATNIAISAPYDTGKSSFLLSYFTQKYEERLKQKSKHFPYSWLRYFHKDQDFLNRARLDRKAEKTDFKFINLPNFFLDITDKKESEIELEKDIIGQLLFSSKPQKYPDSRIKRLKQYPLWKIGAFFIVFILFWFSTYLVEQDITRFELPASWVQLIARVISIVTGAILLFSMFCIGFHGLPKIGWTISTKILNTKLSAKFDVNSKEKDKDLFLLYGDELKYYFDKSKVRYLIFEDLDRYNNPLIFQRLRQLNINLNHGVKHNIVFIYTLRDSVFDDTANAKADELAPIIKETKFFDYIIPMVPLHSTQNSVNRFKEEINSKSNLQVNNEKWGPKFYSVQEKYLWGLGAFILDVRAIVQICSELSYYADLFKQRLDNGEIDINKLLGVIVYKNVYPRDYEKLLSSDSFLNQLFLEVDKQKEINLEERKNEVRKLDNEIRDIGQNLHHFRDDKDVDLYVYYDKFVNKIGIYDNEKYGPNIHYQDKFWDKFFKDTSEEKKKIQKLFGWSDELTEALKERREETLDKTKSKYYLDLNEQKSEYEDKKASLQNKIEHETFLDILSENYNSSEYKALSNIKKLPILNYLITSGLIGENYYEYVSPSLVNNLAPQDLNFVRSVLSGIYDEGKNLQNIPRIIATLDNSNADYRYVQSPKVLSYLLMQSMTSNIMQHIRRIIYYWGSKSWEKTNFINDCVDSLKIHATDGKQVEKSKRSGIKILISALVYEYPEYFRSFNSEKKNKFMQTNNYIFETFFSTASERITSKEIISEKRLFDTFVKYNVLNNIALAKLVMKWDYDSWKNLFKKGRVYRFNNLAKIFGDNLTKNDKDQIYFLITNGDYVTNTYNFDLIVRAIGGLTALIEREKDLWGIDNSYIVKCLPEFLNDENLNYENLLASANFTQELYDNQPRINLIQTLRDFTWRAKERKKITNDEGNYILSVLDSNGKVA